MLFERSYQMRDLIPKKSPEILLVMISRIMKIQETRDIIARHRIHLVEGFIFIPEPTGLVPEIQEMVPLIRPELILEIGDYGLSGTVRPQEMKSP
jgi:hypothetical protein